MVSGETNQQRQLPQNFTCISLRNWIKKRCSVGVYCDLSKAFDCAPHPRLLHKLWVLGIRGNVHDWFKSYLTNRKQYVDIFHSDGNSGGSRHCYDTLNVEVGVSQGSILAPVLFSLCCGYCKTLIRL